jgi:hypothetical protein
MGGSALTCLGGSFYRFVMFHLSPVTEDINLHSICQLQQKIIEIGMPLHPTRSRSYPGSTAVNTKAYCTKTQNLKEKFLWPLSDCDSACFFYIPPSNTSISGIKTQVTLKVTYPDEGVIRLRIKYGGTGNPLWLCLFNSSFKL